MMTKSVTSEVFPNVFGRVQFWGVRGQLQENDVVRENELWRAMPAGAVHDKQGDCSRTDAFPDFDQMLVHGFDVDGGQHQSGANATGRADGTEQIGPGEAPVAQGARPGAAPGPDAG